MGHIEIEETVDRVLDRIKDKPLTLEGIYMIGKELRKELEEGVATLEQMLEFAVMFCNAIYRIPSLTTEQKNGAVQAFSDGFRVEIRRVVNKDGSKVSYEARDVKTH